MAVQQALQTAEQDAQTYLAKIESRMMMYARLLQLASPAAQMEIPVAGSLASFSVFSFIYQGDGRPSHQCCACRTGVGPPTVEVRFQDLTVQTSVYAELSRNLPSVMGFYRECMDVSPYRHYLQNSPSAIQATPCGCCHACPPPHP